MGVNNSEPNQGKFNWSLVAPHRYRNNATGEIIDENVVEIEDDNELATYEQRIRKQSRNVVKLVYYNTALEKGRVCNTGRIPLEVFIEGGLVRINCNNLKRRCYCQQILRGFGILKEEYGPFEANLQMVWIKDDTPKVWLNQNPYLNQFKKISQSLMVLQVKQILMELGCFLRHFEADQQSSMDDLIKTVKPQTAVKNSSPIYKNSSFTTNNATIATRELKNLVSPTHTSGSNNSTVFKSSHFTKIQQRAPNPTSLNWRLQSRSSVPASPHSKNISSQPHLQNLFSSATQPSHRRLSQSMKISPPTVATTTHVKNSNVKFNYNKISNDECLWQSTIGFPSTPIKTHNNRTNTRSYSNSVNFNKMLRIQFSPHQLYIPSDRKIQLFTQRNGGVQVEKVVNEKLSINENLSKTMPLPLQQIKNAEQYSQSSQRTISDRENLEFVKQPSISKLVKQVEVPSKSLAYSVNLVTNRRERPLMDPIKALEIFEQHHNDESSNGKRKASQNKEKHQDENLGLLGEEYIMSERTREIMIKYLSERSSSQQSIESREGDEKQVHLNVHFEKSKLERVRSLKQAESSSLADMESPICRTVSDRQSIKKQILDLLGEKTDNQNQFEREHEEGKIRKKVAEKKACFADLKAEAFKILGNNSQI